MNVEMNLQRRVLEERLDERLEELAESMYHRSITDCTDTQVFDCVLQMTKRLMQATDRIEGEKKLYYISAEFLIGKLLSNNLINLGIYERLERILREKGHELSRIEELESEPSLGNGGLGRLAACFIDSISTLGLPGEGVGLCYHLGLFKQVFRERLQNAEKNDWMGEPSWLTKTDTTFTVSFGNKKVTSRLYQLDVVGYGNAVNRLNLFDLESVDEGIVKQGIDFNKKNIEKNLTLFLYPDDSDEAGNLLRIYQQYFMVSNAAQLILSDMKAHDYDLRRLNEHAVIQINDTHPTLIIPELIRILVNDKAFTMDEAIEVVRKTCAYTNHTILAEALEKWPLKYLQKVVPQLVPIIRELDRRIRKQYKDPKVQIIDGDKRVHMAHIDIHYGFSVNGVAQIHTDILKNTELHHFYEIYPEKFNNKTNGITFRRWLLACNPRLSSYLDELIGKEYKENADALEGLLKFRNDKKVLERLEGIKRLNKQDLADYILEHEGVELEPSSIFDVQIKRLHEYKRQQMNALYIIHRYLEIKAGKKPVRPISFIFGAKAAPAYVIAKDIIHLLLVLQEIVNNDPEVSPYMKVVMVENYNVTYAEKLIPAADISEQISLASKEASGTGNMKMMLNGAVTLGTADGANVEIRDLVGSENIYEFGMDAATVIAHYENADYVSKDYYKKSPVIKEAVDFITGKQALKVGHKENLDRLKKELLNKDWFMTRLIFIHFSRSSYSSSIRSFTRI